ncbi:MAG TPA: FAD binding domain-containing protein [Planctomycetota bacterium]|nr:FAD binding domain-containing protein [Planctomycetota bacterium]
MRRFDLAAAGSFLEGARLAAQPGTMLKAGGVDLIDLLKEHLAEPGHVVSIRKVAGAAEVREDGDAIVIGACATLATVARHEGLLARAHAIAEAAGEAASPQIRNQATAAGNLLQRPRCWYFRKEEIVCRKKGGPECLALDGENRYHAIFGNRVCAIVHPSNLAPALMLFDARLRTVAPDGKRRELALADLFLTPEKDVSREHALATGEVIESIVVPPRDGGAQSAFVEMREKQAFDWPLVAAAVRLATDGRVVTDARIVLGAVAPVPLRREAAEKALVGKALTEESARDAAKAAFADATPLSQNAYKIAAGTTILARAILAAGGQR